MSIETNKKLVQQVYDYLSTRNLPALFALIHEEGSWSVPYRPDMFQFAGFRDKQGVSELLTNFLSGFDKFSFKVEIMTAEDDRVAVEARSEGVGPGAARYENVYNMIFIVKDGKLYTVREYFDPFQVVAYVNQIGA